MARKFKAKYQMMDRDLSCSFCSKRAHSIQFCPSIPDTDTTQGITDHEKKWLRELIMKPQIDTATYEQMTPLQALEKATGLADEYNKNNPWLTSTKTRDGARRALGMWKAIGADATTIAWIGAGAKLQAAHDPYKLEFKNHPSYESNKSFVDTEIADAIAEESFEEIHRNDVKIVNPISVETNKAATKLRMCVDARWHNAHLPKIQFSLESIDKNLADVIQSGDVLMTTDITRAYYAIPIRDEDGPYLTIQHRGRYYKPRVLPFGSSLAPFVFNKLSRHIVKFARAVRMRVMAFYDDYLWCCKPWQANNTVQFVTTLLPALGFRLNDKSALTPQPSADFLGFTIDAKRFAISVSESRLRRTEQQLAYLQEIADNRTIDLEILQSIAGQLISMSPAIHEARIWTRLMYADIAEADRQERDWLILSEGAMEEIRFWNANLRRINGQAIVAKEARLVWSVDTSETAIGAISESGRSISIPLRSDEIGRSSTYRELIGVEKVLHEWKDEARGHIIQLWLDSFAATRNLIKGGGPKQDLNELTKRIWQHANDIKTTLRAEWKPREHNTQADKLSKRWEAAYLLMDPAKSKALSFAKTHGLSLTNIAFNGIRAELVTAQSQNKSIALVHPVWPSQSWWPQLRERTINSLHIGTYGEAIANPTSRNVPDWKLTVSIVMPMQTTQH